MAVYTHLENHDTFYITLSFFILIILLAVLIFCIIMTEIIVYDGRKLDRHTLDIIAKLEKLTSASNHNRHYFKRSSRRKWYLANKIHKNGQKQMVLKYKADKNQLKIQTGATAEQLINLLFEAMSIELKARSGMTNKLGIPDRSISGKTVSEHAPAKTLRNLSSRQNTLAFLTKVFSSFTSEMLDRLISLDISPTITYQDILNRLQKLQDSVIEEQQISCDKFNGHDRINKKLTRKLGEAESSVVKTLIKNIRMTKKPMEIIDPEKGKARHLSVDSANCPSTTININVTGVKLLKAGRSTLKFSDAELSNAKPLKAKEIFNEQCKTEPSTVNSSDAELTTVRPLQAKQIDDEQLKPNLSSLKHLHTKLPDVKPIEATQNDEEQFQSQPSGVKSSKAELANVKPFEAKDTEDAVAVESYAGKSYDVLIPNVEDSKVRTINLQSLYVAPVYEESLSSNAESIESNCSEGLKEESLENK